MSDLEKAIELHKQALTALALELPAEVFTHYQAKVLPVVVAARRWASLTSPETIEKAINTRLHEIVGHPPCESACLHFVTGWTALGLANTIKRAVLRSVEEGKT